MDSEDRKKPLNLRAIDHALDRIGIRPTAGADATTPEQQRAIHELLDEISADAKTGEVWLRARRDLTFQTCPILAAALAQYRRLGFLQIRLDVSQVGFIDSASVALLAHVQQELVKQQGAISLLNPTRTLASILRIVRLDQIVKVVESALPVAQPTQPAQAAQRAPQARSEEDDDDMDRALRMTQDR